MKELSALLIAIALVPTVYSIEAIGLNLSPPLGIEDLSKDALLILGLGNTETFLPNGFETHSNENIGEASNNPMFPNISTDPSKNITICTVWLGNASDAFLEISNAWLISYITDHTEKMKIAFVVDHSLFSAEKHQEFIDLFKYATNLIKSPSKFRKAWNLIITTTEPVSERIAEDTLQFLRTVMSELSKYFGADIANQNKAQDILKAFLTSEGSQLNQRRICYASYATSANTSMEKLAAMNQKLAECNQGFETTPVAIYPNDFQTNLSQGAQLLVSDITPIIRKLIVEKTLTLPELIVRHFQDRSNNTLDAFGGLLKTYKLLATFQQNLLYTRTWSKFRGDLQRLVAEMKILSLQPELRAIKSLERDLTFCQNIAGAISPIPVQRMMDPFKNAIESVHFKMSEMSSNLNRRMVAKNENLTSFVQNQFLERAQEGNATVVQPQLALFSQSLQLLVETSYSHITTVNQFVSEISKCLRSGNWTESLPEFEEMKEDVDIQEAGCPGLLPLKLWKWVQPWEKLLKLFRQKQVIHEMKTLTENHLSAKARVIVLNSRTVNNLTDIINESTLTLSTLHTRRGQGRIQFEATLKNLMSSCQANLSRLSLAHKSKEASVAAVHLEAKSVLQRRMAQQKANTTKIQATCNIEESKAREEVEDERRKNLAQLEQMQRMRADQTRRLNQTNSQELIQNKQSCARKITSNQVTCNIQKENIKKAADQENLVLSKSIEAKVTNCNRELTNMEVVCIRELERLAARAAEEKQRLEKAISAEIERCNVKLEEENQACERMVSSKQEIAVAEIERMREQFNAEVSSCKSKLEQKSSLHNARVTTLVDDFNERYRPEFVRNCHQRQEAVAEEAVNNFRRQKQRYIDRWEESDRCCYSTRGGFCRDGTRGTPCCAYQSCTYQLFRANCCKCNSHCRM